MAKPGASNAAPSTPADATGPQLFSSLQQNSPLAPVVARRHLYPGAQVSSVLQGALAPGGFAPLEKQPAKVTRENQSTDLKTIKE
jgi:hypothetical protein